MHLLALMIQWDRTHSYLNSTGSLFIVPPSPSAELTRAALHGRGAEHCDATASCLVVLVRDSCRIGVARGLHM